MPADLVSEISSLQAAFQDVANLHPWVCLAVPREGPLQVGKLAWPSAPPPEPPGKILDEYGRPIVLPGPSLDERAAYCLATGAVRLPDHHDLDADAAKAKVAEIIRDLEKLPDRLFDLYGPPPWVMVPDDKQLRPIVEHVKALTWRANRLLFRVLDAPNQIPPDTGHQIREWERQCPEYGWLRWLRQAVAITGPLWRIENYPQVAATALGELRAAVGAGGGNPTPAATLQFEPGAIVYRNHREPLSGKPWQVLRALAEAPGRTLSLRELLRAVWGNAVIGEEAVRRHVYTARQAVRRAIQAACVPAPDDPIPAVDRGTGRTAWHLNLP